MVNSSVGGGNGMQTIQAAQSTSAAYAKQSQQLQESKHMMMNAT